MQRTKLYCEESLIEPTNRAGGLLSYEELKEIVAFGIVENILPEQINGTSIDITLGEKILREVSHGGIRTLDWAQREKPHYREVDARSGVTLWPGEFVLASSRQIFNLPADLSCEYKLKSSMARCGLNHLNAGWCDPTWNGSSMTLELVNCLRHHAIKITTDDPIGQVVFFRNRPVPPEFSYAKRGRYNNDTEVKAIKP